MANIDDSKHRLLAIAAIVIVVLLAINAFLLYNKYNQDSVIEEQKSDLVEADRLKIEMDKQYHEALSDLEEMRSTNEELNALIDQQKEELKQQRNRIEQLLKGGGNLDRARTEIQNLKSQVQEYLSRIEQLREENEGLKGENEALASRTEELSQTLQSERDKNEALSGENQSLASEKKQLAAEKNQLSERVTLASVIKINQVNVTGLKERSNGKTVKKRYAKNVDQLRVCFSTEANEVTHAGIEQFFIRIVNPIGETLAIDELGGGVLVNKSTGEEVRYTSIREYSYENEESEICFNWDPSMASFQKGTYRVEIYNKGYLAGAGDFELK